MEIRGDRRKAWRGKDRRKRARTPGKFKDAMDAVYRIERKFAANEDEITKFNARQKLRLMESRESA